MREKKGGCFILHKKIKLTIDVALCTMAFVVGTPNIVMANEDSVGITFKTGIYEIGKAITSPRM